MGGSVAPFPVVYRSILTGCREYLRAWRAGISGGGGARFHYLPGCTGSSAPAGGARDVAVFCMRIKGGEFSESVAIIAVVSM
jgi:hypothetical protein